VDVTPQLLVRNTQSPHVAAGVLAVVVEALVVEMLVVAVAVAFSMSSELSYVLNM
jgi:hypothetical protein